MEQARKKRLRFPRVFWLAIVFEFFERGSYYGMMSVLAVYLTDVLKFPKEDTGIILGVIQPILYFLPILAGALADRFGYRRALTVAFSLLGTGYFLTSQATGYTPVFLALVVMALGAGTFKPIISGTIARTTDESNSSLGFGIYYWTINLGAFLFPLFLVPALKHNFGWRWIFVASALGTGSMLLPTLLAYREPVREGEDRDDRKGLVDTLASAFEIIFSPLVLLSAWASRSRGRAAAALLLVGGLLAAGLGAYVRRPEQTLKVSARRIRLATAAGEKELLVSLERDRTSPAAFSVRPGTADRPPAVAFHWAPLSKRELDALAQRLETVLGSPPAPEALRRSVSTAAQPLVLSIRFRRAARRRASVSWDTAHRAALAVEGPTLDDRLVKLALRAVAADPKLAGLEASDLKTSLRKAAERRFGLLFVALLVGCGLLLLAAQRRPRAKWIAWPLLAGFFGALWLLPSLSFFARGVSTVLGLGLLSLLRMDVTEPDRYRDHLKFLGLIAVYSGFWVMYFQMFGTVLWYVKAYVDAAPLNEAVGSLTRALGLGGWRFDVEHVTVVNAGTIILLQLPISKLVQTRRALPTMIAGILVATVGMGLLALSPTIWVFVAGIVLFSIGEMTAHPKFISFVGLTAPKEKVAMYMGYVFLYGVIGSSVGSILGSELYVQLVDHSNAPAALWAIFAGIGLATAVGLGLYAEILGRKT